jgi:hypothetical protein
VPFHSYGAAPERLSHPATVSLLTAARLARPVDRVVVTGRCTLVGPVTLEEAAALGAGAQLPLPGF